VPSVIWILLFTAVVAGSWWVAWQPMAQVLVTLPGLAPQ
jgi:hypothetical protein